MRSDASCDCHSEPMRTYSTSIGEESAKNDSFLEATYLITATLEVQDILRHYLILAGRRGHLTLTNSERGNYAFLRYKVIASNVCAMC